jgi:hypothetical protein
MSDTDKASTIDWSATLWSDIKGTGWGTGWLVGATTEIGIFTLVSVLLVLICGTIRIGELMAKMCKRLGSSRRFARVFRSDKVWKVKTFPGAGFTTKVHTCRDCSALAGRGSEFEERIEEMTICGICIGRRV